MIIPKVNAIISSLRNRQLHTRRQLRVLEVLEHSEGATQYIYLIKLINRSYVTAGPIPNNAVQTAPLPKPVGVFLHPFELKDKLP